VNIFNDLTIPRYFFNDIEDDIEDDITYDLWCYLYDNLYIEDTLTWDLRNALKTNAKEEYI
jgi:hypothetical protein